MDWKFEAEIGLDAAVRPACEGEIPETTAPSTKFGGRVNFFGGDMNLS